MKLMVMLNMLQMVLRYDPSIAGHYIVGLTGLVAFNSFAGVASP